MKENLIYDTGYIPEQYSMGYQIRDHSDYTKLSKQKKNRKHGANTNKHLSPALVAHHHYHGVSDPYSHGYYSDITTYPVNDHYGVIKDKSQDKKQKDKSGGRQQKEDKDSGYLNKFMTLGKKGQKPKNKAKDNDDIYAIPRPSIVASEALQRSALLKNMRQSTGQLGERKGMVNSKSMGNLFVRGRSKEHRSSSSSEEIYESMEEIRNRKTILNFSRKVQLSKLKKTGHPLFDHLRAKSQEDILVNQRPNSAGHHRSSQEEIPQPVWPKADTYSKHAYHYIDDSSDIYSSSNDELDYKPEMIRPRIDMQHVPEYLQDEINDYDNVYSIPRFADSASRKMRYH